jgi:preprotein translocase subunit SecG
MGFLIGILTVIMVLNCLLLILLVLIQLPKKDAGAGNVLTKVTKYAAGVFFVLAISLSQLQSHLHSDPTREFERQTEEATKQAAGAQVVPHSAPDAATAVTTAATNTVTPGLITPTNLPAPPK